jgi:hypothetical protein
MILITGCCEKPEAFFSSVTGLKQPHNPKIEVYHRDVSAGDIAAVIVMNVDNKYINYLQSGHPNWPGRGWQTERPIIFTENEYRADIMNYVNHADMWISSDFQNVSALLAIVKNDNIVILSYTTR